MLYCNKYYDSNVRRMIYLANQIKNDNIKMKILIRRINSNWISKIDYF